VSSAIALAHPNVALAKYWGKRARAGNFPAVPSLSVALGALATTTRVTFDTTLARDALVLGGGDASEADHARVKAVLDRVRAASNEKRFARVESINDFPTASGLASSASGFAALALAATTAARCDFSAERVSDLARRGSASAARSVFGGWVELEAGRADGTEEDVLAARAIAPADALDVRVLVCVVTEERKSSSSRDGMAKTAADSAFYDAWLEDAARTFASMKDALGARDLARIGALTEHSALAMHACAMAAGVVYVRDVTFAIMRAVSDLRARGALAFATSDAGPHVKVLVRASDAARVREELEALTIVGRVIESSVGGGARLVDAFPEVTR
jgi:diphosphomevalonate decarboxylase